MRILLIEDDPATARLIRENLADTDLPEVEVEVKRNLAEARRDAVERFQVILLDLGLGDSQGLATLHEVRGFSPGVPVVVLTGLDDPDTALAALREGADDYLVKSRIEPELLARAVRYAIERRGYHLQETALLEMLQRVGESLTSQLELDPILHTVVCEALARTAAEGCMLLHLHRSDDDESAGGPVRIVSAGAWRQVSEADVRRAALLDPLRGLAGVCRVADLQADPQRGGAVPELDGRWAVRSLLVMPIAVRHARGALVLGHRAPGRFDEAQVRIAGGIAAWAAVAMDNAALFRETERAARLRDRMLAIVSHDLRGPLNTITLTVDQMARSDDAERRATQQERVRRSIGQMQRLIEDLLDFAAIEADALRVEARPGSLVQVVREACEATETSATVNVVCELPDGPGPTVALDAQRIQQVLRKLIDNALAVSPPGAEIRVTIREAEDALAVHVQDRGPAVSAAERERLFDPFSRGEETSGRSGAGLGLAIARGIMAAHGGTLTLDPDVESGAGFVARFPVVAERVS